jgi:hypothetical protein
MLASVLERYGLRAADASFQHPQAPLEFRRVDGEHPVLLVTVKRCSIGAC